MEYKPPKCPFCEEPLERVGESLYEIYEFDSESGTYSVNERATALQSIYIYCEKCGSKLRDVFPDGACNYQAENRSE